MKNPMLNMLNNQAKSPMSQPNNPMQMMRQFAQFKQQMAGKNPQQMINELLESGKMSQQQLQQLETQAQTIMNFMK